MTCLCTCTLCVNVFVLVSAMPGHEDHLIPYSLVQPVQVKTKRPVIFSPSLLSRGLIERLLQPAESGLKFNTCQPGICTTHRPIHSKGTNSAQILVLICWSYIKYFQSPFQLQRDKTREYSCWILAVQRRPLASGCSQYRMSSAR